MNLCILERLTLKTQSIHPLSMPLILEGSREVRAPIFSGSQNRFYSKSLTYNVWFSFLFQEAVLQKIQILWVLCPEVVKDYSYIHKLQSIIVAVFVKSQSRLHLHTILSPNYPRHLGLLCGSLVHSRVPRATDQP